MSLDAPNSVQGPLPSALASGVQVDKAFLNSVMADPSLAPAGHGHGHDSDEDSIDDGIWEKDNRHSRPNEPELMRPQQPATLAASAVPPPHQAEPQALREPRTPISSNSSRTTLTTSPGQDDSTVPSLQWSSTETIGDVCDHRGVGAGLDRPTHGDAKSASDEFHEPLSVAISTHDSGSKARCVPLRGAMSLANLRPHRCDLVGHQLCHAPSEPKLDHAQGSRDAYPGQENGGLCPPVSRTQQPNSEHFDKTLKTGGPAAPLPSVMTFRTIRQQTLPFRLPHEKVPSRMKLPTDLASTRNEPLPRTFPRSSWTRSPLPQIRDVPIREANPEAKNKTKPKRLAMLQRSSRSNLRSANPVDSFGLLLDHTNAPRSTASEALSHQSSCSDSYGPSVAHSWDSRSSQVPSLVLPSSFTKSAVKKPLSFSSFRNVFLRYRTVSPPHSWHGLSPVCPTNQQEALRSPSPRSCAAQPHPSPIPQPALSSPSFVSSDQAQYGTVSFVNTISHPHLSSGRGETNCRTPSPPPRCDLAAPWSALCPAPTGTPGTPPLCSPKMGDTQAHAEHIATVMSKLGLAGSPGKPMTRLPCAKSGRHAQEPQPAPSVSKYAGRVPRGAADIDALAARLPPSPRPSLSKSGKKVGIETGCTVPTGRTKRRAPRCITRPCGTDAPSLPGTPEAKEDDQDSLFAPKDTSSDPTGTGVETQPLQFPHPPTTLPLPPGRTRAVSTSNFHRENQRQRLIPDGLVSRPRSSSGQHPLRRSHLPPSMPLSVPPPANCESCDCSP